MKRIKVFIKKLKNNKKGFTFVECIVAVALFAIIGTLSFSLFNNATRYMNKAKQEEAKQNAAEAMALRDTYKDANGYYIIYKTETLSVSIIKDPSTQDSYFTQYSVRIPYTTEYGEVYVEIPVKLAPDKDGNQPGTDKVQPYQRYMVLVDGLNSEGLQVGRKIYIYDNCDENGVLAEEYED